MQVWYVFKFQKVKEGVSLIYSNKIYGGIIQCL